MCRHKRMYVFIIVILILISLFIYELLHIDYNRVPKRIWTYIDKPDRSIDSNMNKSIASWKKHTDYEIIILTEKTYKGYVTIPTEFLTNPVFTISDLIRLYILHEMGGVWIDPNVILLGPLDWMFPKYAEFSGIKYDEMKDEIETRFMACNKGSPFMEKWKTEYSSMAKYPSADKYVESKGFTLTYNPIKAAYNVLLYPIQHPDSLILQKNKYMIFI